MVEDEMRYVPVVYGHDNALCTVTDIGADGVFGVDVA